MLTKPMVQSPTHKIWRRAILLGIVGFVFAAFFVLGLDKFLTFEALKTHRSFLMAYVAARPLTAALLFVLLYAAATACSLPGGAVFTLAGGFLFGIWWGTGLVVIGATAGTTLLFLLARSVLGDALRGRAGPFLKKMEAGFRDNALSYLLVLRLIPAFPFFIVNLVPAFLGVPLTTYVIGTLVGIIPGTFVFASIGAGLGSVFDSQQEVSLKGALTPEVITALVGLAVLSLIPVVYKKLKTARAVGH